MRVTFEHKKEGKNFVLYSTLDFTEEEKAVIQQRGLGDKRLAFGFAEPIGAGIDSFGLSSATLQTISRLFVLAGIIAIFTSIFARTSEGLPLLLFFIAFCIMLARKAAERRGDRAGQDHLVQLKQLIASRRVRSYSTDATAAKALEEDIRNQLTNLKEAIKESTVIPAKQTYEI